MSTIIVKKDKCGIGSNFLRLLDWLWYTKHSNDNVYIDWMYNGLDLLAQVFDYDNIKPTNDYKYFDHYVGKYHFELNAEAIEKRKSDISFYTKYGVRAININSGYFYTTPHLYFEPDFYTFRKLMFGIYSGKFSLKKDFKESLINDKNILGVHVRAPLHYCEKEHNGPFAIKNAADFFEECSKYVYNVFNKDGYEKIYVACDIEDFFGSLLKYFDEKQIVKTNYLRLTGDKDWTERKYSEEKMFTDVFTDIFNLSRCDKLICGVSNMTLTSMIVCPELKFEFFPRLNNLHSY